MKTTRIFIAAFAAALSLVSCTKENADQKNSSSTSEPRVFTLEFSKPTRTTLNADGITPEWKTGDKIWISNSETGEEVTVSVSGETATISTKLKGTLTAVYPSDAVVKDVNGVIIGNGFTVPAAQHGTFAESNICMATNIAENAETITFVNKTAVLCFYVDESIGVTQLTISGEGVSSSGNSITVTPSPSSSSPKYGGPDDRICYVAISATASGTTYAPLTLTSVTTTQTAYANSTVTREIPSVKLKQNEMYNAFIPYYIEVEGVKWGYCNVGAFLPEEYGEYFAWGETTGHTGYTSTKKFENDYSFSWTTAPFNGGKPNYNADTFNGLKDTVCPDGVLASSYDAATQNWGSDWRMPTKDEFTALTKVSSWTNSYNSTDVKGRVFSDEINSVFFPAAGYGSDAELDNAGSIGNYWSSSLNTVNSIGASYIKFTSVTANTLNSNRLYGQSVRPVSVLN